MHSSPLPPHDCCVRLHNVKALGVECVQHLVEQPRVMLAADLDNEVLAG